MTPEQEIGAAGGKTAARAGRRRGKARPAAEGVPGEPPLARVMELVAALKAEQEAASPLALASDASERVKLMGWLKRFLAARDEERGAWEARLRALEARLNEAGLACAAAEQEAAQQHRLIADLRLMHEHQRSIWQLERRRLEITLEGFETVRRRSFAQRAGRLARPALAVGLLLVSLAAVALSADSHAVSPSPQLYHDDGGRSAMIVFGGD